MDSTPTFSAYSPAIALSCPLAPQLVCFSAQSPTSALVPNMDTQTSLFFHEHIPLPSPYSVQV